MTRVVQATCPGCKNTLRIPADWVRVPLRCKHCNLTLTAKTKDKTNPAAPKVGIWRKSLIAGAYVVAAGVVATAVLATQLPRLSAKPIEKAVTPVDAPEAAKGKKTQPEAAPVEAAATAVPVAKVTPIVLPPLQDKKLDVAGLAQRIDQRIQQKLDSESVAASPQADDAEFLRRVYLDIIGVIPPADKAAAFLDSKDSDKRAKLIDELLTDSRYGRHMSDLWQDMLLPRTSDNRRLQPQPLITWLEENFNSNKPWDKMVYELITASGAQDKNGAVTYFLANASADKMVDNISKQFLGLQLQCAQCHNHPFTDWKQNDYWGMAAFFLKVRADNINAAAKTGTSPGISEMPGKPARGQRLPESAKILPAKYLGGDKANVSNAEPQRPAFARWMTSKDNAFFAKAMANRMWHHFFGKGIVNPVDDMHNDNPPSHPELLQELAGQFAANDFDLKFLVRAICNSQTYQRTSKPTGNNAQDDKLFSHMAVKVLYPEQLFDSLESVVGKIGGPRQPQKPNAQRPGGNTPRAQFVAFFQTDEGADPTEYQSGIPQALRLMNSAQFSSGGATATEAAKAGSPTKAVEHIYLNMLSRRPTTAESNKLVAYVAKGEPRKAYGDIVWAVLNSSEFTLNH